jgi:7-cyano-7-deazaguanine synthase
MPKTDGKAGPSAVVLLSAGLDSTYNLLRAREKFLVRLTLTFDYGQKAAVREIERASALAESFKIPHKVISLPWFSQFTKTSLLGAQNIPSGSDIEIDNLERSKASAKNVWVPNRNGILLNIAAGFAEGLGADYVIPGFNIEEAQTFADNSDDFLKSLDHSWSFSTNSQVKTFCFSTALDKTQIVAEGRKMGMPFAKVWPCYLSGKTWCGQCESCQRFKRAVEANGLNFEQLKESSL